MEKNLLSLLPFGFRTITILVLMAVLSLSIGNSIIGLGDATPDYSYDYDDSSDYSYDYDDSSDFINEFLTIVINCSI